MYCMFHRLRSFPVPKYEYLPLCRAPSVSLSISHSPSWECAYTRRSALSRLAPNQSTRLIYKQAFGGRNVSHRIPGALTVA